MLLDRIPVAVLFECVFDLVELDSHDMARAYRLPLLRTPTPHLSALLGDVVNVLEAWEFVWQAEKA
jgi:hypothetical protein